MPRPPQTESTSTPSVRAADRSGVPTGKRPRLPEGVKTTSGSFAVMGSPRGAGPATRGASAPFAPAAAGLAVRAGRRRLAEARDPALAVRVVAHHHVRAEAGAHGLGVQRIRDRGGEARGDRHREEGAVDAVAVRQAEADVRGAAGRVDPEFVVQAPHEAHHLHAGLVDGADRHDERVDDDVARRDAVIGGALDDALGDREAHVRVFRDAGLVVADRDDRGAVLLDERQHRLEAFLLAGHGVHERLALVDAKPGLERRDDGGIDRQRQVGDRLHELDGLREDRRLVGERNPGVDVQHVRAGFHLRARVGLDAAEIARGHFGGEELAPGRIDALADDHERAIKADDDLARGGTDDGVGHAGAFDSSTPFARTSRSRSASV